jgi:cysteine-rich repeat protein
MRITNTILYALTALAITACNPFGSDSSSLDNNDGDCTLTQGYWKNHPDAWPTGSLQLGTNTYTKAELLVILKTPVRGNGLISLSHQLIAAKLNVAAGATDATISATITAADALIGSLKVGTDTLTTSSVSALVDKLAQFNEGAIGPGHCGDNEQPPSCDEDDGDCDEEDCDTDNDGDCDCDDTEDDDCDLGPVCGNGVIEAPEACDDGNTIAGDGCSATCTVEHVCVCGDGVVDAGEACDDGNTTSGDGCSATCTIEEPVCVCGNGVVEAPEACDDGNTTAGDGCSATCTIEPQPVCGNGVVETGETCDDGNTTSGDHCSSTCQTESTCPTSCGG